jgi:hypothetical protein
MDNVSLASLGPLVKETSGAAIVDLSEGIAGLVFTDEKGRISHKTAAWAAEAIKEMEDDIEGIVVFPNGGNFCCGNVDTDSEDPYTVAKSIQSLSSTIRHYRKPVVAALKGMVLGAGYDIALNCHAIVAEPTGVSAGYDFRQNNYPPMGGGLTAQIIDAYSKGEDIPGIDLVPVMKKLQGSICFPKKTETTVEMVNQGILPKATKIALPGEDVVNKGKIKARNMSVEGFEPVSQKKVSVLGKTGSAALKIIAVNMYMGGFMTDSSYDIAVAVGNVIGGGEVPKGTEVTEARLLELEARGYQEACLSKDRVGEVAR